MLEKAQGTFDSQSQLPIISFKFNAQGARRFADITRDNVGRRFAAVLDDKVITAPVIRSPILGGQGQIEGDFTIEEANETSMLAQFGRACSCRSKRWSSARRMLLNSTCSVQMRTLDKTSGTNRWPVIHPRKKCRH